MDRIVRQGWNIVYSYFKSGQSNKAEIFNRALTEKSQKQEY
jgi:hypothetical protein